jgi:hypothetical protein
MQEPFGQPQSNATEGTGPAARAGLPKEVQVTPEIEVYRQYVQEKIAQLCDAVSGLSEDDLNRAPNLPGANSPFVIVTHTYGNMRAWILGIVCGQDLRRDRPGEFASRGTLGDLTEARDRLSADVEDAVGKLDPKSLDDRFEPKQELWGEGTPREIMRRAGFVHVLEHAGIHLGHIHMTAQLLQAGR